MLKLISSILIAVTMLFSAPTAPASAKFLKQATTPPAEPQLICAYPASTQAVPLAAAHSVQAPQETIYGQVVYISDGDTIHLQPKYGNKIKIRLYGIDAPEKAQPYGPQSTGILRQLIGNQYVEVKSFGHDRYGRCLGKIYLNRQDINAEMLRLGAAWHYKYYDKSADFQSYADIERFARQNNRGLWNRPNPTPPWEYRKMMRAKGTR